MTLISDEAEINRRENARTLSKNCGGQVQFADRIQRQPNQINHIIGPNPSKNIGKRLARHIEKCFGKPEGWLDRNHLSTGTQRNLVQEAATEYPTDIGDRLSRDDVRVLFSTLDSEDAIALMKEFIDDLDVDDRVEVAKIALAGLPKGLSPSEP